ncbi:hypothetical protein B0H67DRAFT_101349 [Lasiosphaeris hirsuta]|uniref:Uncharacterized protein n=1 Tax=Lasiosphaeris hirsuta TaxID=260670 RepID=A0AA40E522_9PEZI|nr:hypothetical protein B0H67DRAFT_101349 [Lasiosphaeris hirsuta]
MATPLCASETRLSTVVAASADTAQQHNFNHRRVQLRSNIEDLAITRDATGPSYLAPNDLVKEQPRHGETYNGLRLLTEALRVLFTVIDLLNRQHAVDDDAQSLEARSSTSNRCHSQIALVEQKLPLVGGRYDATAVCPNLQRRAQNHADPVFPGAKCCRGRQGRGGTRSPIPNQHFVIATPIKTCFTGRKTQLAKLEAAFRDLTRPIQQKFVTYGLSGSGKTELAFKYAHEHQNKFWGVFFVDGSSKKNVTGSYTDIATLGGVEPNEKAAKAMLSGICEWPNYLKFYDHQIERIRRSLHSQKRDSSGNRKLLDNDTNSISVFSTYEILYKSLQSSTKEKCQDAVESNDYTSSPLPLPEHSARRPD